MKETETILNASNEDINERLDRFVCNSIKDISRSLIQKLIRQKSILVNNKNAKASYKLKEKDEVKVSIPAPEELNVVPENIELDIVFEDKDLIVINKPQGMVTHPASGNYNGTLVNALLYHCRDSLSGINGVLRPGIVHRLDKDTSGLIIVCKNDKSHLGIADQIKERKLKRSYYVLVHGEVKYNSGIINKPIGRDKVYRHKMAVVPYGRKAITHWKVLKKGGKYTLLECNLETGRTHQIRVHMSSIGHPIVGDKTYGKKFEVRSSKFKLPPMMLHAYKLIFTHPRTKKEICLEIKTPERFSRFLNS